MMELTGDPIVPWVCLIGMVILSVATALPRRRQKSVAKYLGEITLQWVAWTVGIMTAFGGFWDDPIFIAVPLAAFVAVAGSWLRHMINVPMQQPTA